GQEVRVRYAAIVRCTEAIEDENGKVVELRCTWDPATRRGATPDGRKVRGTIHWVSASHAVDAEVRLYDRLFTAEEPDGDETKSYLDFLNPDSKEVRTGVKIEPGLAELAPGTSVQFERLGYFVTDEKDHTRERPVFNRTITLKDTWAKIAARS